MNVFYLNPKLNVSFSDLGNNGMCTLNPKSQDSFSLFQGNPNI